MTLAPDDALARKYLRFCAIEGIEVAGIEFITDRQGQRFTYDVNGTTNYSSGVEQAVGVDGMRELAKYIKGMAGCASLDRVA